MGKLTANKLKRKGRLLEKFGRTKEERDAGALAVKTPEALLVRPQLLAEWLMKYNKFRQETGR